MNSNNALDYELDTYQQSLVSYTTYQMNSATYRRRIFRIKWKINHLVSQLNFQILNLGPARVKLERYRISTAESPTSLWVASRSGRNT